MKHVFLIPAFILVCALSVSCNHANDNPLATRDAVKYPVIDTMTVGLKSESGQYALVKYYVKRTSKDVYTLEGSADNKIGNENWKVVTRSETRP